MEIVHIEGGHHMKKKRNHNGFTLGELLIVVGIIAVLVAISIPIFNRQLEKSRDAASVANIRSAYSEAMIAYMDMVGNGKTYSKVSGHKFWVNTANNYSDGTIFNIYSEPFVEIESKDANNWSGLGDNLPFTWKTDSFKGQDRGNSGMHRINVEFNHDGTVKNVEIYQD